MEDSNPRSGNFPSKKDGWLVVALSVTAAIEAIAALALITVGPASVWSGRILPFLLVASAVVIVWSLFGTAYRVEGADLVIRSGPFRTRVPIASIASVAPTHSVNAALAMSTSRLDLCCTNPEKHVLVSPKEPAAFIGALRGVKPTITVVGNGPAHA
jgi:hypothetical protein